MEQPREKPAPLWLGRGAGCPAHVLSAWTMRRGSTSFLRQVADLGNKYFSSRFSVHPQPRPPCRTVLAGAMRRCSPSRVQELWAPGEEQTLAKALRLFTTRWQIRLFLGDWPKCLILKVNITELGIS